MCRQQKTIKALLDKLAVVPPRLPSWLYVGAAAIPALRASLTYWVDNTSKTTQGMLAMFRNEEPNIIQALKFPGISPSYRAMLQARIDKPLRQINSVIDAWGPNEARGIGVHDPDWSDQRVMQELAKRRKDIAEMLLEEHLSGNAPPKLTGEAVWFQTMHVYVPPKELWAKHPEMEEWKKHKKGTPYSDAAKTQVRPSIFSESPLRIEHRSAQDHD